MRTGVSIELERVINKTLAKNQEARYQHMDEIQVDLRAVANKVSVKIKSPIVNVDNNEEISSFLKHKKRKKKTV